MRRGGEGIRRRRSASNKPDRGYLDVTTLPCAAEAPSLRNISVACSFRTHPDGHGGRGAGLAAGVVRNGAKDWPWATSKIEKIDPCGHSPMEQDRGVESVQGKKAVSYA